jgi:phosphatidylglycerophosphate synthase
VSLQRGPSSRRLTLSNGLTGLRLAAAPLFYCAIVAGSWSTACLLFWLAVASDWVDGRVARARGESSSFGGFLDHASDAAFVSFGLAALALPGVVPVWLPVLVVLAFGQYALDSRVLAGRPLRASALGRWNGILYFVPPGIIVTREALALHHPSDDVVMTIAWILVFSTLLSMADRIRALFASSEGPRDPASPRS